MIIIIMRKQVEARFEKPVAGAVFLLLDHWTKKVLQHMVQFSFDIHLPPRAFQSMIDKILAQILGV